MGRAIFDLAQLNIRLMKEFVQFPDRDISIAVGFMGEPLANLLHHKKLLYQLVYGFASHGERAPFFAFA